MIDFSLSQEIENTRTMLHMVAETTMRPLSRGNMKSQWSGST
jgi:hypothetical protein